jgi:hypothetical protein
MPEPVGLLSSAAIRQEEFVEFLHTLRIAETDIIEHPSEYYDAQLIRGKQNVWVALENKELDYIEEEDARRILQKLGSYPQTYIVLDISKQEAASQQLAMEFVAAFAARWSCVVDDLRNSDRKIYSGQEIVELHKKREGFWK